MKNIRVIRVSIFDHWLTETEANDCKVMNYLTAIEENSLDEYLVGERSFVNLYLSLGDKCICYLDNERKTILLTSSSEFNSYLIEGLREMQFHRHHMIYPEKGITIRGGYDRTDTLILNEDSNICDKSSIYDEIEKNGLFILEDIAMNYEQYIKLCEE